PTPAVPTLSLHDALPIYRLAGLRGLRHDLLGEVNLFFLDALAETVPDEANDLRFRLLQEVTHALVRILDERLTEQRDLVELLAEDRKSTRLNSSHVKISY